MKVLSTTISLLLFSLYAITSSAQTFTSTQQQTQLIELYTSEGCSSCPPADDWLNQLKQQQGLWTDFIPVAFHVDYWDDIGWKDRFASKAFSQRQQQLAYNRLLSSVYTPAMLINSYETNSWRRTATPKLTPELAVGKLIVDIEKSISVNYSPLITTPDSLLVNVAVLGMNLTVDVNAGENKGRTLHHDFVVLDFKQVSISRDNNNHFQAKLEKPLVLDNTDKQLAIAVWVSDQSLTAVQATGGLIH